MIADPERVIRARTGAQAGPGARAPGPVLVPASGRAARDSKDRAGIPRSPRARASRTAHARVVGRGSMILGRPSLAPAAPAPAPSALAPFGPDHDHPDPVATGGPAHRPVAGDPVARPVAHSRRGQPRGVTVRRRGARTKVRDPRHPRVIVRGSTDPGPTARAHPDRGRVRPGPAPGRHTDARPVLVRRSTVRPTNVRPSTAPPAIVHRSTGRAAIDPGAPAASGSSPANGRQPPAGKRGRVVPRMPSRRPSSSGLTRSSSPADGLSKRRSLPADLPAACWSRHSAGSHWSRSCCTPRPCASRSSRSRAAP